MKNSPSDQPRFTCRVVRGALSIFGDTTGREPRGPGAAHVAACEDCQQFFGACDDLTLALKRDAAREWRNAPTDLEQKIMRAVHQAARDATPAPSASRGAWFSLAGVAACAVFAVLVYEYRTQPAAALPAGPGNVAANPVDPALVTTAQAIAAEVPGNLFAEMQPQATALLQEDPLQNEVDAITADARKAVGFLARNFLPTPAERPASGE